MIRTCIVYVYNFYFSCVCTGRGESSSRDLDSAISQRRFAAQDSAEKDLMRRSKADTPASKKPVEATSLFGRNGKGELTGKRCFLDIYS